MARSRHYWTWTITGYAMTVLSVPFIGASHALAPALPLDGTERLGTAVRSPAKDTLLSHASTRTGRGRGFGVHQAMDQFGAMAGPLPLAAVRRAADGVRIARVYIAAHYPWDVLGGLAFGALIAGVGWLALRVPLSALTGRLRRLPELRAVFADPGIQPCRVPPGGTRRVEAPLVRRP